ncbi:TetR/AcrR family transcriptional regulator [Actinomycetospora termitidis]|uniref:TetR family transcriptional regulator n=1 Tax=Actinomycetospora termitidis TaxID=3053470 RepID=A0ABT7MC36_9PSEU|nr:TetR/AcrR family transcriptional regulator [Actinomycetospora sp. Odt1-22]MDL5158241.1 TetR family transcriptional regulator [Actinomycetospora sp. Odt1-22]
MERRDLLAEAAIDVLATAGARGLTHRAVDAAAGLAEGTSSYYFRTRAALLDACCRRLASDVVTRVGAAAPSGGIEGLVERACAHLERVVGPDRPRLVARLELSLESTRRPELEAALVAAGAQVRAGVAAALADLGVADPQDAAVDLVACLDGLAFDQVAGAGRSVRDAAGRRRAVTAVVEAFARVS